MLSKVWNWLLSFFNKEFGGRLDVYSPKERLIYSYFDGKEMRKMDPMILYKRQMEKGPEIAIDIKVSTSTLVKPLDASKAQESLNKKLREIFDVKSYEEGGLTEGELMDLFDHFLTFVGAVKKKQNQSLTPSQPIPQPPKVTSKEESPPTSNTLDSTSTKDECSTEKQPQSSTESESPSVS